MTDTSYRTQHADALQILQVWSKTVTNEGHFTLEDETVCGLLYAATVKSQQQ
jgi:hypothetical protein